MVNLSKILLNLAIIISITSINCQSPCPEYFSYLVDEKTREIFGRVTIPKAPKNIRLHLRVSLSIPTALSTNYIGKLELARSKEESARAVEQGLPLIYNLRFPTRYPTPLITEVKFNDHQYCAGPRAVGPIVTNIFLEHYLYPPQINFLAYGPRRDSPRPAAINPNIFNLIQRNKTDNGLDIFVNDGKITVKIIPQTISPTRAPSPGVLDGDKNCGRPANGLQFLVAKGEDTLPGQWPWLAGIFITKKKFEFQCAGSLISDKHVLTAAHCRRIGGRDAPANNFLVSLGRFHLENWREKGAQTLEVDQWIVHPDYQDHASAHGDLALLVLRGRVNLSPMVQPVCLWRGPSDLAAVVGQSGYIVGWGRDEHGNQHLAEPRVAQAPIVSQEDCLRSNIGFVPATTNKTFCAGRRDGSGPCNGDSGSGLVFFHPLTNQYYLRGIVSLSLLDRKKLSCDLSQYVVYVDVAKFLDWINSQLVNLQA